MLVVVVVVVISDCSFFVCSSVCGVAASGFASGIGITVTFVGSSLSALLFVCVLLLGCCGASSAAL